MRKISYTGEGHFHFVTFSTNGRRNLLALPEPKQIVIYVLNNLVADGDVGVSGFVVMPNHIHAVLRFDDDAGLPQAIQTWKRAAAQHLRTWYEKVSPAFIRYLRVTRNGREIVSFWQRRYFDFNISSEKKLCEKLEYIHWNPVKKGLAQTPAEYKWSSAAWYFERRNVGVPIYSTI